MNIFKDVLNGILSKIQEIHDSIVNTTAIVKKIVHFFDILFQFIPVEFIILLLGVALLMIVLNSISPTTPRINLFVSLFILDFIWYSLSRLLLGEVNLLKIAGYTLIFAVPAYGIVVTRFIFLFFKRQYLYKKLAAGDFNLFRQELEKSYHNLMSISHAFSAGKTEQLSEFKSELKNMEIICEKFKL